MNKLNKSITINQNMIEDSLISWLSNHLLKICRKQEKQEFNCK
jgi:hypothetical protein